jgi:hypothetical protein
VGCGSGENDFKFRFMILDLRFFKIPNHKKQIPDKFQFSNAQISNQQGLKRSVLFLF